MREECWYSATFLISVQSRIPGEWVVVHILTMGLPLQLNLSVNTWRTYPEMCFHGEPKFSEVNDEDEPLQLMLPYQPMAANGSTACPSDLCVTWKLSFKHLNSLLERNYFRSQGNALWDILNKWQCKKQQGKNPWVHVSNIKKPNKCNSLEVDNFCA